MMICLYDTHTFELIAYLSELLEMNERKLQLLLNYINLKDCSFQHSSLLQNSCYDSNMQPVVEQIVQKLRGFESRPLHEFVRKTH